jgi:hypothetical protein
MSLNTDLAAFAARHGGATAVIEHTGRRGIRLALVGADGTWGDLMAADEASAVAACQSAKVAVAPGWARELADSLHTNSADWRRMGGNRRP